MKTATYKIKMKDGSSNEVTGSIINGVWGIDKRVFEKKTYTASGEERVSKSQDYYLTHIPSGMLVTNSKKKRTLMEIANLSSLMDENDPRKILTAVMRFWDDRWWKD